jgi:putative dimethyl sulfoxide reductase chaperone
MTAEWSTAERSVRGEAYWFIASLFARAPDAGTVRAMRRLAGAVGADEADLTADLVATIATEDDAGEVAGRLAVEHARLFGGLGEGYGPPPPYESLWREGVLMGESAVAVADAYREAGYTPSGAWMPPDHLVEELEFLAALYQAEDRAYAASRDADAAWSRRTRERFVGEHLGAWVPDYCRDLGKAAREPFYRALASLTASVLEKADEPAEDGITAGPAGLR